MGWGALVKWEGGEGVGWGGVSAHMEDANSPQCTCSVVLFPRKSASRRFQDETVFGQSWQSLEGSKSQADANTKPTERPSSNFSVLKIWWGSRDRDDDRERERERGRGRGGHEGEREERHKSSHRSRDREREHRSSDWDRDRRHSKRSPPPHTHTPSPPQKEYDATCL